MTLAAVLYTVGMKLNAFLHGSSRKFKMLAAAVLFILCGLAILVFSNVFFLGKDNIYYVQYRSINGIEISISLLAVFFGYVSNLNFFVNHSSGRNLRKYIPVLCFFVMFVPYYHPIVFPLEINDNGKGLWRGNVCLQSTGTSCAPSAMATVFKYYGIDKTEAEIAKVAFTSALGTEDCYVLRYALNNGLSVKCYSGMKPSEIPVPSIIAIKIGEIHHAVAVIGHENGRLAVADPLFGLKNIAYNSITEKYKFKGIVYHFIKN